ncbi:Fic family protein [Patescibacteria group bacterium]|nr:MAG: Fic family protein [Patescibacteria group bacterium]
MRIGANVKQKEGYKAFIPDRFPPGGASFVTQPETIRLLAEATLRLGKLDGITKLLPDIGFFIFMYVKKEAAYSSQIEGTRAKLSDALQAEIEKVPGLPQDVDDILHYIQAMDAGLERLKDFPLTLRLLKDVHEVLMTDARSDHDPRPGQFRNDQNWIDGTSPFDARYVPPPAHELLRTLGDLEMFLHKSKEIPPLLKAGIAHAQFETIHPFRDGNGRMGRLLMTFYLCQQGILARPVLYLSAFLKKHRKAYFERLDEYREGSVEAWLQFFLKGVIEVATEAIATCDAIVMLRERDMVTIALLPRKTSVGALAVLKELYKSPIINARRIEEVAGVSRQGAYNLARRLVKEGILHPQEKRYGQTYKHKEYLKLFEQNGT